MRFRDFLKQLATDAASVAHHGAVESANQYLTHFRETRSEESVHEAQHDPKTHDVPLTDDISMVVPEPALVTPKTFRLKDLELNVRTDLGMNEAGELEIGLTRGLRRRRSHCRLKVVFQLEHGAEGAHIVQERMNSLARDLVAREPKEETDA